MDWNISVFISLGLTLIGAVIWIIRLEGKVKLLNESLNGAYGIHSILQEIKDAGKNTNDKLSALSDRIGRLEVDMRHLVKEHNRINKYHNLE